MHTERLRCYLEGGRPPGSSRTYPGARDPRMPVRSAPVELPGTVYFATESPVWTGGRAFYDPTAPGTVWARAHLVTVGQFADIATQEMYAVPGEDRALDLGLDTALITALASGIARLGPGRYETLVCPGSLDALPRPRPSPPPGGPPTSPGPGRPPRTCASWPPASSRRAPGPGPRSPPTWRPARAPRATGRPSRSAVC